MEKDRNTQLRQIADRLCLGAYPPALESVYRELEGCAAPACDMALIDNLQKKYNLFAEFYDLVKQSAAEINADPDLNTWVRTAAKFHRENDKETACKLPVPVQPETPAQHFMMLHIMMPMIEEGFSTMAARGFSQETLEDARTAYAAGIRSVQKRTGKPGINKTYFSWLNLYCRAQIFNAAGFLFELRKHAPTAFWLRNRETKQIVPLMLKVPFFRDGSMPLGAKNYEDPEGAFTPEMDEDAENYYGYGCIDHIVSREKTAYPKAQWECVGAPGEYCLALHIPKNTDISRESTVNACKTGLTLARERFPEYGALNCVFCTSWLLNPKLKSILGEQSRITQFQKCFVKYPHKDTTGTGVFHYIFSQKPDRLEDLEENTSLQRAIKKLYLEGDCLHIYRGACFLEESYTHAAALRHTVN